MPGFTSGTKERRPLQWFKHQMGGKKTRSRCLVKRFFLVGVYDSFGYFQTRIFLYMYIFHIKTFLFVYAAPIRDKTRKPKLLKPQPRKLVLVSRSSFFFPAISSVIIILCLQILKFHILVFFDGNSITRTLAFTAIVIVPNELTGNNYACLSVKLCST